MQTEYPGRGDPTRTKELLWSIPERGSRGPKPILTIDGIVTAAIEGIEILVDKTSRRYLYSAAYHTATAMDEALDWLLLP